MIGKSIKTKNLNGDNSRGKTTQDETETEFNN